MTFIECLLYRSKDNIGRLCSKHFITNSLTYSLQHPHEGLTVIIYIL